MSVVCVATAGIVCIFFLGADLIKRILGDNGMQILTKFMGMVLVAIAMSMFASGAKGLLPARLRSNRVPNDVFADEYSKTREDPTIPVPC